MPHNMLATLIDDWKLTDNIQALATHDDIELEVKALGILDKLVKEVANDMAVAQDKLTSTTAEYEQAQTRLTDVVAQIKTHEGYALAAVEQQNEALALEVAEKIASLEKSHESICQSTQSYAQACSKLTDALHQNEVNLFMLKQQIDKVKAKESMHKAQIAISLRYQSNSQNLADQNSDNSPNKLKRTKLRTARQALADMYGNKLTIPEPKATLTSSKSPEETDKLYQKLVEAGIASKDKKAEDVLARIKNKPT